MTVGTPGTWSGEAVLVPAAATNVKECSMPITDNHPEPSRRDPTLEGPQPGGDLPPVSSHRCPR
jgi:hypothetical protein